MTFRAPLGRCPRIGLPGLVLFAAGCAGDPEPIPCNEAAECPVVDEAADDGDVRALWGEGQKLMLSLDEEPSEIEVVGGEVVFTPDPNDLDCEGPCAITLKRLRIVLKDLYFVSSEDSVKVSGLELAFNAPLELANPEGVGSILPVGSETLNCATVQGLLWAHQSTLSEANVLVARATNESLTFDVSAEMPLDGSTVLGCRPFDLKLTGTLTGVTPFDQNPTATE